MSISQVLNFDDEVNFNLSNTEIEDGVAQLLKIPNPGQIFSQNFASDSGFTYDSDKAEFTGGLLRQKDQRPENATFGANYDSGINANWGGGTLTGSAGGGASVSGGKLILSGAIKYVDYSGANNTNHAQIGTIRYRLTPNYSGTPSGIRYHIVQGNVDGSRNATLQIFHSSADGNLAMFLRDDVDNLVAGHSFGLFNPTSGQEYEIELNYNFTSGVTRMFVDGVELASVSNATVTRSLALNFFRVGASYDALNGSDCSINDVVVFSTVQHTAGYTPGYVISSTAYLESGIALPDFEHQGVGFITELTLLAVTESGSPKYTIEGKYWNGSAWVASDGTYSQASPLSVVNSNFESLTLVEQEIISVSVVFQSSNTQSSVDDLVLTHTHEVYADEGYIEPTQAISVQEVFSVTQEIEETDNSTIKIIIKVDGVLKYFNGSSWVTSDGTFAQSNTAAVVNANLSSLEFTMNSEVVFRWVISSSDENESATITTATIEYDFGAISVGLATCIIYGFYKDIAGQPIIGANVAVKLSRDSGVYVEANNNIIEKSVSVLTDAEGYFEFELVRTSEFEDVSFGIYEISITKAADKLSTNKKANGSKLTFTVPDLVTKDITDLF